MASLTRRLTPKQALFCREYLIDMNGAAAARRAGYSAKTADQIAINLIGKSWVLDEIKRLIERRARACEIDATGLLRRLVEEVDADLADLFDQHGIPKPLHEWPAPWRRGLVVGIEVEVIDEGSGPDKRQVGTVTKLKFSDRLKRLELIGKHVSVGAFREKVHLDVSNPLDDLMKEIAGQTFGPKGQ